METGMKRERQEWTGDQKEYVCFGQQTLTKLKKNQSSNLMERVYKLHCSACLGLD